ncbi:TIGR02444 family protein [Devosia nitrariae]|uniref:TIGR02444 family protein n=1 Tax=Devosia nitrariae TaxID=2071872 RepID=A0ABQ5W6V6_9HYPH|nr:TIGR02444 family protein [Devosia nitrariae]GLQ55597.1 hypothetical protein GCM10010862_28560 [Devosia nitrariae]
MDAAETGENLWRFAVTVYAQSAVAEECLAAQRRHGCDVCVLLAAAFAAAEGRLPDARTLAAWDAAVERWRSDVVKPLRTARDALKSLDVAGAAELRRAVLGDELQAERIEFKLLAEAATRWPAPYELDLGTEARVAATMRAVTAYYNGDPVDLPILMEAVTAR